MVEPDRPPRLARPFVALVVALMVASAALTVIIVFVNWVAVIEFLRARAPARGALERPAPGAAP